MSQSSPFGIAPEETPSSTADKQGRSPLRPDMIVKGELTLDQFLGDQFLEISDDALPSRILETLRAQGIDPAAAGLSQEMLELLRDTRTPAEPAGPVKQAVQPQVRRQGLQRRLNEQSRTLAMKICNSTRLAPTGCKFALRSGTGAGNDLTAVIITVQRAVNDYLGIPKNSRRDLSVEQLETVLPVLDTIGDTVQAEIAEKLS
jgi:hypothetical protein